MPPQNYHDLLHSQTKPAVADGWAKYSLAYELLEQSEWAQGLRLLAQAETIFRIFNEVRGLWRTLIGQALVHWRDGMTELAEARGLAAMDAASAADDGFAVGYVTWQLANLKIEQENYDQAADYLEQAQLALDAAGLAPAGGIIAAAAQLCQEIVRWEQMYERGQIGLLEAQAAIGAIRGDLTSRLRQVVLAMRIVAAQSGSLGQATEIASVPLPPLMLPPAELPGLPWIGLSAWLRQLWRTLIHGGEPAAADRAIRSAVLAAQTPAVVERAHEPPSLEPALSFLNPNALPALCNRSAGDSYDGSGAEKHGPDMLEQLAEPKSCDSHAARLRLPADAEPAASDMRAAPETEPTAAVDEPQLAAETKPQPTDTGACDRDAMVAQPAYQPTLAAQLFGPFRVVLNDQPIEEWTSGRGRAVLKYMLAHHARPLARDVLMETFWPEAAPESARNSLNVALHGLRQALKMATDVPVVIFHEGAYQLNAALSIWLDIEDFERHVQAGRHLQAGGDLAAAITEYQAAIALYQGDFMADDPYEEWPVQTREYLRVTYLDTLDRLGQLYFGQGQYAACAALCLLMLAQDNCREDAHCRLMRCYGRQGQHHLALRQYQSCAEALRQELDVEPSPATTQLYERIRRREPV